MITKLAVKGTDIPDGFAVKNICRAEPSMKNLAQSEMATQSEIQFPDGTQSSWKELTFAFKTLFQLLQGFRALHFVGPYITLFGSARFKETPEYYELTCRVFGELAKLGFTIMTGGGPGLMEAANRGAKEAGERSSGVILNYQWSRFLILIWTRGSLSSNSLSVKSYWSNILMPL